MNINSHNTVKYFILKLQKILYDANYNNLLQNFCQISSIFDLFLSDFCQISRNSRNIVPKKFYNSNSTAILKI